MHEATNGEGYYQEEVEEEVKEEETCRPADAGRPAVVGVQSGRPLHRKLPHSPVF